MFDLEKYLIDMEISVTCDESLKKHGTMKVGGSCKYFVSPNSIDQLITVITICKMYDVNYFVIGNASNIIFTDKGYDGAIICTKEIKGINLKDKMLTVKCGNMIREVANYALENELSGFENLCGIPATIGGAVFMNAGAYGSEIKDIIVKAKVLDKDGNVYTINKKDMHLAYRHTNFNDDELLILEATFMLKSGNREEIYAMMKINDAARLEKQPISEKSVGSTFKRPKVEGLYASKLIDDAGLKGYAVGGARVSEKHAGFVVSDGTATFEDLKVLIEHITKVVYEKNSVELELEAIIVGEV